MHQGRQGHQEIDLPAGLSNPARRALVGAGYVRLEQLTSFTEAEVLLVNDGDPLYLCYWMRQSGLADLLPKLGRETVYVGLSAGSMVMTPSIGEDFVGWKPPSGDESTLGLVDFSIFPHLDNPDLPYNTLAHAERWAAGMPVPGYAMDDQTAIQVVDGEVSVISEGHWKLFKEE